jgi:hypothetical protein
MDAEKVRHGLRIWEAQRNALLGPLLEGELPVHASVLPKGSRAQGTCGVMSVMFPNAQYVEVGQSENKMDYTESRTFIAIICSSADPDQHFLRFPVDATHHADLLTLLFAVMLADANCVYP